MSDIRARLYLVTPHLRAASDVLPGLESALAAGDVACLLLRLHGLPEREAKQLVREVARIVQGNGTALLLEDPRMAARTGADGVHIRDSGDALAAALDSLKPERIVGVGGLASRDAAMRAGEAGADYVMFGEPEAGGDHAAPENTLERVAWWAEIFNVPCIGFAGALGEVEPLASAGADFVALGDAVWGDPRGAAAAVAEANGALRQARALGAGETV